MRQTVRILAIATLLVPRAGLGADLWVDRTDDVVDAAPGDGLCAAAGGGCSLRAAIQEANALLGDDRVFLPAGTYTLSIVGDSEDAAATGDLDVTDDLEIRGAAGPDSAIDADALDRVLDVVSGVLRLFDILLLNGRESVSGGGGCLRVNPHARLVTEGTNLISCESDGSGGGLLNAGFAFLRGGVIGSNSAEFDGGGIANFGTLTLAGVWLVGNAADSDGGALRNYGAALVRQCLFQVNPADGLGGAIHSSGRLDVLDSTFTSHGSGAASGVVALSSQGTGFSSDTLIANSTFSETHKFSIEIASGRLRIANSIVASGPGCSIFDPMLTTSLGGNLDEGNSCDFDHATDLVNTAAMLGLFAETGGPTGSIEPLPGSPAIDGGVAARCGALDQRFFARPVGARCDRGAVEFAASPPCGDGVDNDGDGAADGADPDCTGPTDALETSFPSGHVLLLDATFGEPFLIDPATGTGPFFERPAAEPVNDVAVDAQGRILMSVTGSTDVYRLDARDGGPLLDVRLPANSLDTEIAAIAVGASGAQYAALVDVAPQTPSIQRFDTGEFSSVSQSTSLGDLADLAVSPVDGQIFVTDRNTVLGDRVWRVDPDTGTRTTIASAPDVSTPTGVTVEDSGNVVFANAAAGLESLTRLDPAGIAAPDPFAALPSGSFPLGLALEEGGDLLVSLIDDGEVERVHPATGVGAPIVSGGEVDQPARLAVVPSSGDPDGDGVPSAYDLCPEVFDPSQADAGGFANALDPAGAIRDGRGDACSCGDLDGDHVIDAADEAVLREALAGVSSPAAAALCNTRGAIDPADADGDGLRDDCTILDRAVLARTVGLRPLPGIAADACAGVPEP